MVKAEFKLEYTEIKGSAKVTAVILAGGKGTRMGSDKQLISLCGIPVIARSIMAFSECEFINNIVVVTNTDNMKPVQDIIKEYNIIKVTDIVLGGESREQSVINGVKNISGSDIVLIHDGARPLIKKEVIERVKNAAEIYGAAIPVIPLKDTVKTISPDGKIINTPNRNSLFSVQTPQGFSLSAFNKAVDEFKGDLSLLTDDSMLLESAGYDVYSVNGDEENIKITLKSDITIAEGILGGRNV